jgi:hypothetical protein
MDELREKGYAYLKDIELMFYVMTGCVCLMLALTTYWPISDETPQVTEQMAPSLLPSIVIWAVAGLIALLGIIVYFILRQHSYSYISWMMTEAGPRLQEPLPAYLRVPLLWRIRKQGSGLLSKKQPYALFLTEQRYVQTCLAMGVDPSQRPWQIASLVLLNLGAVLFVVLVAVGEATQPSSSKLPDIFAWARPLMPFLQLLVLGVAITLQGGFAIWTAQRYGRINAILDNRDAMAYAMRNTQTGMSSYRGD